nr:hypothetical protein [Pseudoclavibacter sp. Marseille-Q3772]
MRVERAELYVTNLELNRPFVVSYETYTTMPSIVLALHTDRPGLGIEINKSVLESATQQHDEVNSR